MWSVDITGFKRLTIQHLVFDFNGTLAIDGKLIHGMSQRLQELAKQFTLHVVTADTFGQAAAELSSLPVQLNILQGKEQATAKLKYIELLGPEKVIALGNGRNDRMMLEKAALGILVIQQEGAATVSLQAADMICHTILDASDLILNPKRLVASLRD
ncbi:MAG: hypothetical protein JXR71_10030 [Bacteroidales bacterium]|nr:hypothetical protein [Bacteroidales bacterium]